MDSLHVFRGGTCAWTRASELRRQLCHGGQGGDHAELGQAPLQLRTSGPQGALPWPPNRGRVFAGGGHYHRWHCAVGGTVQRVAPEALKTLKRRLRRAVLQVRVCLPRAEDGWIVTARAGSQPSGNCDDLPVCASLQAHKALGAFLAECWTSAIRQRCVAGSSAPYFPDVWFCGRPTSFYYFVILVRLPKRKYLVGVYWPQLGLVLADIIS